MLLAHSRTSGKVSGRFLYTVNGTWTFVNAVRRPFNSLLGMVFKEQVRLVLSDEVVPCRPRAAEEFAMLAFLSPAIHQDLRASFPPEWCCSDASHIALGAVTAPIDPALHAEL